MYFLWPPGLSRIATPQALDLIFAVLSFFIFAAYHCWYYSWHLWSDRQGDDTGRNARRLDMTGQTARYLFTKALLASATDANFNLATQVMRNPITAASILGTGASVGVTTLINVVLDSSKMNVVRQLSERDPLTGGSSIISPEAKLGTACASLFLSFFALAQALRLFVHYPFLICAVQYCRSSAAELGPPPPLAGAQGCSERLDVDAVKTCLRGQTFFSLGLRFLYAFIPLCMWTMGGTWLLAGTCSVVACLYVLDQL